LTEKQLELAQYNEGFWEHFSDHLIIAFSFLFLGAFLGLWWGMNILQKKFKIDPNLDKSQIMRVYTEENKKWFIVNPVTKLDMLDMLWLTVWDRKKDQFVDKADLKVGRIIMVILFILLILSTLSGVILLFSALTQDVNIFNHL
jgi:uncharacterized protein YneF (UPF0154 family)